MASLSNSDNVREGLKKLKFLVIMDPLVTETSEFWKNHGEYNDVDPRQRPNRGVPPAHHLLCRGRWRDGELLARAAVALEGGRCPG